MVDGGSLENCCTERYRGFESLRLRELGRQLVAFCDRLFLVSGGVPRRGIPGG